MAKTSKVSLITDVVAKGEKAPPKRPPGPKPLTEQEMLFAANCVNGMSQQKAWFGAGYKGTDASATVGGSKLYNDPRIRTYIEQLRKDVLDNAQLTLQKHLDDLLILRNQAARVGNMSAAIGAEIARGRAAGLYDKPMPKSPGDETGGGQALLPVSVNEFV